MDIKERKYYFCDVWDNINAICQVKNISYNEFVKRYASKSSIDMNEANKILKSSNEIDIISLYNICSSLEFYNFDYILFAKKYNSTKDFILNMLDKFLYDKKENEQLHYLEEITNLIYKRK